jgi:hypothetical protein
MSTQKKSDISVSLEDVRDSRPVELAAPARERRSVFRLSTAELDEFENRVVKLACVAMTCITLLGILIAALVWLIKEIWWLIYGPMS